MTPSDFIAKWSASELRERQGAQSHFNDLCSRLGELHPSTADPKGQAYCFERGAPKVGGGWSDMQRRGCPLPRDAVAAVPSTRRPLDLTDQHPGDVSDRTHDPRHTRLRPSSP